MNTTRWLRKYVCVYIGVNLNKFTKMLGHFYLLSATDEPQIKNIKAGFIYLDNN